MQQKNMVQDEKHKIQDKIDPKLVIVIVAVAILTFVGILSETGLNIAYSVLMGEFGVEVSLIQWLTTGYLLTLAIIIPISPVLVKNFRTKRLFQTAATIFIIGTVCCACSTSFWMLLAGRIIQAVGTGISLPLLTNIVLAQAPFSQRGFLMGIVGLVTCFAPAMGPVLGGFFIEYLNWHWIFIVMIPFLLISFILGSKFIVDIPLQEKLKADVLSVILSAIGFAGVVYGVSVSGDLGWNHVQTYGSIIVGLISLGLFAYRQTRIETPLIHMQVFSYPVFSMGVIMLMAIMMTILATGLLLPILVQNAFGRTSMIAALAMLPGAVLNGFMTLISGKILDQKGPKVLLPTGFFIVACAMAYFSFADVSVGMIVVVYTIMMFGGAMLGMTSQTIGLNQLSEKYNADGSAVMNTMQQVSGAIGTAIASSIMSNSSAAYLREHASNAADTADSVLYGGHMAFLFFLVLCAIGLVVAFLAGRRKSA